MRKPVVAITAAVEKKTGPDVSIRKAEKVTKGTVVGYDPELKGAKVTEISFD